MRIGEQVFYFSPQALWVTLHALWSRERKPANLGYSPTEFDLIVLFLALRSYTSSQLENW